MSSAPAAVDSAMADWREANQRFVSAALADIRAALERHVARARGDATGAAGPAQEQQALAAARRAMPAPPALERLAATFTLSSFEQRLLLLCAAVELDASFAPLCAAAQGDATRGYPTFGLALAALPDPHWRALAAGAPLRRHRLVEVGTGPSLTASPLRIDERILLYLVGIDLPDERLAEMVEPAPASVGLVPSHQALATQVAAIWAGAAGRPDVPVVQLCGDDAAAKRAITAAACAALGLRLSVLNADSVPTDNAELWTLIRLWEREVSLGQVALLLACDELDGVDAARVPAISRLLARLSGPALLAVRERLRFTRRTLVTFDVPKPGSREQWRTWQGALGPTAERLNGHIEGLVSHFNLSAETIQSASADALARVPPPDPAESADPADGAAPAEPIEERLADALWEACRVQARPRLDDLAQRIEASAGWDDLVLPEAQRDLLREIALHVRQRGKVYEQWGFASKGSRGLGISALFAGTSGTGKTMAAEALASELRLDLYRIDLSATVSKYIGETEKNLRRIFDAAEEGGAILLFDEADALFGKRSEVKDSHDRYGNIEVSYLLQRMESYRGLAILTTNLKNSLDTAFLRRIRFVVQFPFPDVAQRAEIWRRIFPVETPLAGVDVAALARLNVAGGNIRNIALNAAFLAAEAGERVRMAHLLHAAHGEYAKLEKALTESELIGWDELLSDTA